MEKKKKAHDGLKTLHAFHEDVRRHAVMCRTMISTYIDRFKTSLGKAFVVFSTKLRDATEQLVKNCDLCIKKIVDVIFAVVDEKLQTLETELSYTGPILNSVY